MKSIFTAGAGTKTVTIIHGAGNIITATGRDIVLAPGESAAEIGYDQPFDGDLQFKVLNPKKPHKETP